MLTLFSKRCVFCGEKDTSLESVGGYGLYGRERKYFHRSCLQSISCDPEHYKHIQVDMAIQIADKLTEENNAAHHRKEVFKEQCAKIKTYYIGL